MLKLVYGAIALLVFNYNSIFCKDFKTDQINLFFRVISVADERDS